jgi:P-type Ca2+ transporter type 2C
MHERGCLQVSSIPTNCQYLGISFITALVADDEVSVLSALQLLWINLIMDSPAAFALATDHPRLELVARSPDHPESGLITYEMIRMIVGRDVKRSTRPLVALFV